MQLRRVLCLWFPNWPLQRRVEQRGELRCQRVLIMERLGQRGQCIVACSPLAYRQGARVAMPVAEAMALLPRASDGPIFQEPHEPEEDLEQLRQLARWSEQFSPLVGLEEVQPKTAGVPAFPESLFLDITHLERLYAGEQGLIERIKRAFKQRGLWVRYAIADTPGAAWALAHEGCWLGHDKSTQHNLGEEQIRGRTLGHGQLGSALDKLPVEALRLPQTAVTLLHQLGLYQIHHLRALPRNSLLARFGPVILQRLDQAYGRQVEIWNMLHAGPIWRTVKTLEPATQQLEQVQWAFEQALKHLTQHLHEHQQGVVQLQCALRNAEEETLWKVGVFRPTCDYQHLWELGRHQMQQTRVQHLVDRIVLEASQVAPLEHRQAELFQNQRTLTQQWTHFVNRISNRLGPGAVVKTTISPDSQPEHAFHVVPLTNTFRRQKPKPKRRKSRTRKVPSDDEQLQEMKKQSATQTCRAFARPLQFFEPEIPLEQLVFGFEEHGTKRKEQYRQQGVPSRFCVEQREYHITRYWGPERIETGWWRGASVRRDYYRVATREGIVLWIFFDLARRRWFLHGQFI